MQFIFNPGLKDRSGVAAPVSSMRERRTFPSALWTILLFLLLLPSIGRAAVSVNIAGFNPDVNGIVLVFAQQADGKVLIGGQFTTVNGVARNRIARLNVDGSLDTGFDPGGGVDNSVRALFPQADGKVLIGGEFASVNGTARNHIARLNADGSLDIGFNPGTGPNSTVRALSQQVDGKVLIGGDFTAINGAELNYIARLNADGSLDTGFNPGTGPNSTVRALSQQADGKVLIGGEFTSVNGTAQNYIARLNVDGNLDTGFELGSGGDDSVHTLFQQADGKVLIGGEFTSVNGTARNRIARLNADGSLDTGFDPGTGASGTVRVLSQQADGEVLIGGSFRFVNGIARSRIARLNADGRLDIGFNPGSGASSTVFALSQQADGKVLIGGSFTFVNGTSRTRTARLNADGSLDKGFDLFTRASSTVYAIAHQADGKVLIGGEFISVNGTTRNRIARLNVGGSLDTGFDPGSGVSNTVYAVALQADGKMLIGGEFTSVNGATRNRIARLNADGSLDTGFDPGSGASNTVRVVSLQADGKVLIGGQFTFVNDIARNRIALLNADGSLDTGFDLGSGASNTVYALSQQADGKVLIGGEFTAFNGNARNRIARLNAGGSLDTGFDPGSGASNTVYAVAQQADGKMLIGGEFTAVNGIARNRIARLNADGSLDTGFDPGSGPNSSVFAVTQQVDGKVIIGGDFTSIDGTAYNRIARLNATGGPDIGFDLGSGANSTVFSIAQQTDGRVLVGGEFTSIDGTAHNYIARLVTDEAALQTPAASNDGSSIQWLRGGASPTLARTTFEFSSSLVGDWTMLGEGQRIAGGWQLKNLSLPMEVLGYLRARGYYNGGVYNGSGSVTESIRQFYLTEAEAEAKDDSICIPIKSANGNIAMICL